jgi:4-hydroxybenzoate decarboxylase subunit C
MVQDLRKFLDILRKNHELVEVEAEVDPILEIAEIHRRTVRANGPCLLFNKVKGSPFRVVTNLFGSKRRLELACPDSPKELLATLSDLLEGSFSLKKLWKRKKELFSLLNLGTKTTRSSPLFDFETQDISILPALKCWPKDGGRFLTLPLIYTESPKTKMGNLGMYRMQLFDEKTLGLHAQLGKGAAFHLEEAKELGKSLDVTVFLGGPPSLILSAIAPLPEGISELLFTSLLLGEKIQTTPYAPHPLISSCEFALIGKVFPEDTRLEGPFGDHYGNYGRAHHYPVFHLEKLLFRKDAIFPATCVGIPIEEDFFIGNFLQELLTPFLKFLIPSLDSLWSYGEAGFHPIFSAIVKERHEKEALTVAMRLLGEGQLSLSKFCFITDQKVDLKDFPLVLEAILARFDPRKDLVIFSTTSNDSLDYTGPKQNLGSKAIFLGTGTPIYALSNTCEPKLLSRFAHVELFCPGCLVVQGPSYEEQNDLVDLFKGVNLEGIALIFIVDDARACRRSQSELLFRAFSQSEPARDLFSLEGKVYRNSYVHSLPLILDARKKPNLPEEVEVDPMTKSLVDNRWKDYGITV